MQSRVVTIVHKNNTKYQDANYFSRNLPQAFHKEKMSDFISTSLHQIRNAGITNFT